NRAATQRPVVSGNRSPPRRACVYRSSSSMATVTLASCACRTRPSLPTSALSDTLFGAENVASHPARWLRVVAISPCLLTYVRAAGLLAGRGLAPPRIVPIRQPVKCCLLNLALQAPARGELPVPHPADAIAVGVVVFRRVL